MTSPRIIFPAFLNDAINAVDNSGTDVPTETTKNPIK
jgi:hypothetical protein